MEEEARIPSAERGDAQEGDPPLRWLLKRSNSGCPSVNTDLVIASLLRDVDQQAECGLLRFPIPWNRFRPVSRPNERPERQRASADAGLTAAPTREALWLQRSVTPGPR